MPAPSLANLIAVLPLARDMRYAFEQVVAMATNLLTFVDVFRVKHYDTGGFRAYEVPAAVGHYKWNGATKFILQNQSDDGYLPSEITPGAVGTIDVAFTANLPDNAFAPMVFGGLDSDGRPGQCGGDWGATKTAGNFRFKMTKNSAITPENLTGFTIVLFRIPT